MIETTKVLENASQLPLTMSSISSLSSQTTIQPNVSRTYKHANQLFLTRRIPEALSHLETVICEPNRDSTNDRSLDSLHRSNADDPTTKSPCAPVAAASRAARVKTWTLYLAILNEIIEMGPETAKELLGAARYKALAAKTRDGSIWEEVVVNGYAGSEAIVDAEVVASLYGIYIRISILFFWKTLTD